MRYSNAGAMWTPGEEASLWSLAQRKARLPRLLATEEGQPGRVWGLNYDDTKPEERMPTEKPPRQ